MLAPSEWLGIAVLINMTVTMWQLFITQGTEALHLLSHINRGWPFSRIFMTSFPFWMDVAAVCSPFIERRSNHPWVLWLSLSGMICEHWWELRCFISPIPNSRGVKESAENVIRQKIGKVVFTFTSRDQGWEESWGYTSDHLIISMYSYGGQAPDTGHELMQIFDARC